MKTASTQSYEILFSKDRKKYYHVLFKDNSCKDFFIANIPKEKTIILNSKKSSPSDKELITIPQFTKELREKKIDSYYTSSLSSNPLEKWAKKNKIKLLSAKWAVQEKLEDKIFFDKLVQKNKVPAPNSVIPKNKKEIDLISKFPGVVQVPHSHGSQGTFFVKNKKEITDLIDKKKVKFPFLYREYINGIPLGVSLIIGKKEMIFSSMRIQAISITSKNRNKYLGIQWIKTSYFSKETIQKLNKVLQNLGKALQKLKLYGTASLDFIIKDGEIFLIECNPRLSLSSIQISQRPELLHGFDFNEEFIKGLFGKRLSGNKPFIPNTNYEGCTLDLDFFENKLSGNKTKKVHKVGIYKLGTSGLKYLSDKIEDFAKDDSIFIDHKLDAGKVLKQDDDYGMAIAHKSVLKAKNGEFTIDNDSKILKGIEKLFLENF
ncbi:ATP-grasp domain-containing protein [Candidatus Gracilibacteria bacterium]|nr:ATP-grasp domain-containing protein [Candidatus Gracilibacteria bacterium]